MKFNHYRSTEETLCDGPNYLFSDTVVLKVLSFNNMYITDLIQAYMYGPAVVFVLRVPRAQKPAHFANRQYFVIHFKFSTDAQSGAMAKLFQTRTFEASFNDA